MNTNIKKQLSEINGLFKLYNKSNISATSFYNQLKKRSKHIKK